MSCVSSVNLAGRCHIVTKTDLVNAVAKSVEGLTKKKAAEVVDAVFEGIHESLKKDDKVQIVGFGTFEVQKRAARQGRNPQRDQPPDDVLRRQRGRPPPAPRS